MSKAILGLLEETRSPEDFPEAQFSIFQSGHFEKPPDGFTKGISLYLFRVGFNTSRRNLPPRREPNGRRFRPSTPLDLSYLLTAWSSDAEEQQRFLGWAIRTLQDTPMLPAGFLNRFGGTYHNVFGPTESVELVGDQPTPQDMVNIWEVAKHKQQPSVVYLARLVTIDSPLELTEPPPVRTREFGPGQLIGV